MILDYILAFIIYLALITPAVIFVLRRWKKNTPKTHTPARPVVSIDAWEWERLGADIAIANRPTAQENFNAREWARLTRERLDRERGIETELDWRMR